MPEFSAIQNKFVVGSKSAVGDPRRKWEDRVFVGEVQRRAGNPLVVGIVADGVGSADAGARGAQLAIDVAVQRLAASYGEDIPALIAESIEAANSAVLMDNEKNEGDGLTTLVMAVIYKDRCYVGNVGDSRAYWVQPTAQGKSGRVLQLTRDHSYFNIYGGDKYSQEANHVVNYIGKKAKVNVDVGFYLKKREDEPDDLEKAYKMGIQGLPLKPGDSIVLCSDGLIKDSPEGVPYTTPVEISDAVQSEYLPDRAAIKMVSTAEGRRPDDNVSAVTIQYLLESTVQQIQEHSEKAIQRKKMIRIFSIAGAAMAVILIGVLAFLLGGGYFEKAVVPGEAVIKLGQVYYQMPGQSKGEMRNQGDVVLFGQGSLITSRQGLVILGLPGYYDVQMAGSAQAPTQVELYQSANLENNQPEMILRLLYGKVVVSGSANADKRMQLIVETTSGRAVVEGTIMGVRYDAGYQRLDVDCLEGHCALQLGQQRLQLVAGEHSQVDAGGVFASVDAAYWDEFGEFPAAPTPTAAPLDEPTATRQPTATPFPTVEVPPTAIPPTLDFSKVSPVATTERPLQPGESNRTSTPMPTALPTAVPPTAVPPTAVPPTDVPPTAVPPTAVPPTDVPPTDVPPTAVPPPDVPPPDAPPDTGGNQGGGSG